MKMNRALVTTRKLATPALAVSLLLGLGCAGNKSGYQQADRTGSRIAKFRSDVVSIKDAVEEAVVTLGDVMEQASTDPRKAFNRFSKAVDRLESADEKARRRADQMRAEGKEFFSQWEQEVVAMQNEDIKQLAAQRRQELDEAFRNISRVIVDLKDTFRPWLSDLNDLRTLLGRDLSMEGIHAARQVVTTTQIRAAAVQKALDDLVNELNSVETLLTAARG
jgi:flagellar biosynthesis GTPase FlhF